MKHIRHEENYTAYSGTGKVALMMRGKDELRKIPLSAD